MKKLLRFSVCLILAICVFKPVNLKSNDLAKANKYYDRYDYHYAIEIYERLMRKKPSLEVAQKLANAYKFVNNVDAAETAYAKVLTFSDADPINYIYYADILKQKAKFALAKQNYLAYATLVPEKSAYATKLANDCDLAELWLRNPDYNYRIENEASLNSDKSEFSPVIFNDGLLFVSDRLFASQQEKEGKIYGWTGNSYVKIYQVERSNPTSDSFKLSLVPELNDEYHNGPIVISSDGKTAFFTRAGLSQDTKSKKIKKGAVIHKSIFFSEINNGVWSKAEPFVHNNTYEYSVQHPALSPDGKILYFVSDMPGGFGGMDLYFSENINGTWSKPINCGPAVNTAEDEVFPYLRNDGKLFFSSRGHQTIGGLDIFSAEGQKNVWSNLDNLKAPINSSRDDFGIIFFEDHQSGYISSNREGGKGGDDIYRFNIRKEEQFFAVEGKVQDKKTGENLSGLNIYLINKNTDAIKSAVSSSDGTFRFELEKGTDYVLRGDMDKFFSRQEGNISTKGLKESTVFNVKFEIERAEEAYLVRLNNIYYDFDKYNIRTDAEPELNRVAEFMKNTPDVKIELRAHTDSRGAATYNMALSEKRAVAARTYLTKQGIEDSRLNAKGFGETELLNKCSDGVTCTKEEHQLNRRTEFKVVKVNPMLSYAPTPSIKR